MKKNISIIFLLLGTIIGAGFCSGKEICVYFAKYGFGSLFFLPLFFLIYFFLFRMFLNLGRKKDYPDFSAFNSEYGKNNFFDLMLCFIYIIFSSAMFACIQEMGQLYFDPVGKIIVLILSAVFCMFMLMRKFNSLKLVNMILIPIVLVVILTVCILSLVHIPPPSSLVLIAPSPLMLFTPIIYACQGITLSFYILVRAGRDTTKKSANIISFVASIILTIILGLAIITFNVFPQVLNEPLPFVMLTFNLGMPMDLIYAPILFFAISTTLLSSTRALCDYLSKYIKKPLLRAFLTTTLTLILSFFGFDMIIESLYPIIGCLGLILIMRIIFCNKKQAYMLLSHKQPK